MSAGRLPDRLALISDIHANADALAAVLADVDRRGIRDVWCLGDTAGYGPEPVECVRMVRSRCGLVLQGNHDFAVRYGPIDFNPVAAGAILCHVRLMRESVDSEAVDFDPVAWLGGLPTHRRFGEWLFVHSSPRDPTWEYLFIDRAYEHPEIVEGVFDFIERACFCGHTHFPGAVVRARGGKFTGVPARGGEFEIVLPAGCKAYVNVGSVGQPRDGDNRATYVEMLPDRLVFRRVAYDYRATMAKIRGLGCIDDLCAARLEGGK